MSTTKLGKCQNHIFLCVRHFNFQSELLTNHKFRLCMPFHHAQLNSIKTTISEFSKTDLPIY